MARYQIENPEVVEFISESEYNSTAGHNTDSRPQPLPSRRRISLSGGLQPSEAAPTWGGSSKFADSDPARAPLLGAVRNPQRYHIICYHKQICLRSRPVLLVLLWNFFISFSFQCVVGFTVFYLLLLTPLSSAQSTVCVGVSIGTATLLLFPIAIYLADIKFKRHKVILASVLFALLTALIIYLGIILLVVFLESGADLSFVLSGVVIGSGGILFLGSYIAFTANVVQFGMDQFQAQDVHKEGPVLFVHWYVWTSNLGNLVWKIDWGTFIYRVLDYHYGLLIIFTFLIIIIIIGASACFAYSTRTPSIPNFASSTNSYSKVYQVIKYSLKHNQQHTNDYASTLDVGKEEHGGPFTANQVEKVKVYAKIFCILLTLGPIFAVDTVASVIPSIFATHMDDGLDNDDYIKWILSYYDLLTFILILLIIPFYICLVGPSVYIPGRLKRIGIGVVFIILSLTSMLLIDIIGHKKTPFSTICFISDNFNSWNNYEDTDYIYISSWFIVFSYIFNAFARIFLDVAMYEFICVTSPRDLIGLCFGTLYAIKGIFQLFAVVIVLLPFNSWSKEYSFPSCGLHTFLSIL